MEEAPGSVAASQEVRRMGRAYSARSLSAFSVDENVLDLLWDEEVHMEELLEFSFDHVDKLAQRHGKTVTEMEKLRLWDYIQQMRHEEPYWVTPETVPWEEVEARYALPSGALPEDLAKDLLFCQSSPVSASASPFSRWASRPQLKSPTAAEVTTHGRELFAGQLSPPAERFTLSEEWNSGSPQRGHVASAGIGGGWKRRWRRLVGTVFPPASAKATLGNAADQGEPEAIATDVTSPPIALAGPDYRPPAPATCPKQRPGGFIRRSLRRMALGTKRRRHPTSHPEADNA